MSIALLYLILFDTGSHPNSWNMKADGVASSTFNMIWAARFAVSSNVQY